MTEKRRLNVATTWLIMLHWCRMEKIRSKQHDIPKDLAQIVHMFEKTYETQWSTTYKNQKFNVLSPTEVQGSSGVGLIRCQDHLPWGQTSWWYLHLKGDYNLADFYGVISQFLPLSEYLTETHPYNMNNEQNLDCYGVHILYLSSYDEKEIVVNNHSDIINDTTWYQPKLKEEDVLKFECDLTNPDAPTLTVILVDRFESTEPLGSKFGFQNSPHTISLPTDKKYTWYPCIGTYSECVITIAFENILKSVEKRLDF
ncbi:hypothetical protein RFI_18017 [Reticulomyxa filosa]|uniref:Uncharacterized protein n=1 Tax=Reticulomyxa filosa TaxID=46433 RepID=X6MZY6_RETFI|nr:hypothetical protein RFI_18017 [Reticulomyxa filosa]|eukprot:ETO19213.1 hypothetical protein RFI_18017 [Reticulomyxa filosa]